MAISALLAMATAAIADEMAGSSYEYTPTGDALWDRYAVAWLDDFAALKQAEQIAAEQLTALPDETLALWEAEYARDPRYWQLRYWNATLYYGTADPPPYEAVGFLLQGKSRGAADAITEMLLYEHDAREFRDFWDRYVDGELAEDELDQAPEIAPGVAPYSWYVERVLARADELVGKCPDESWAWYARAMKRFEYGEWEDGLEDLRRGNAAHNNRVPYPYPVSLVVDRTRNGEQCGNDLVAGMVASSWLHSRLPNFILIKDQAKSQELRLSLGAPISELAPWHHYTCRQGTMEGAPAVQMLVALVIRNMFIRYLLVDTPESLTYEERTGLWSVYHRGLRVREIVKYRLNPAQPSYDELSAETKAILKRYGLDPVDHSKTGEPMDPALYDTGCFTELMEANFHWAYASLKAEYGEEYQDIVERFEEIDKFDFATFSWPDDDSG